MKKDKSDWIFFGIFALFFGYLLITGEPIYVGDTRQYESQMIMREPLYPLLIQFLRFLSPDNHYWLIITVQNVLAVFADTAVISYMRRRFGLNMMSSLLFTAILLLPHIMAPIFSVTHLILTNALMTEGVMLSLYPPAFLTLIDMIASENALGKESLRTIGVFLLMSLVRGQMMVLFVVWLLVAAALLAKKTIKSKNTALRGFAAAFAVFIAVLAARSLIVRIYNYCEQGLFVGTVSGKAMAFANVLYVAERTDGEAIEDDELRELFYNIFDSADMRNMNYKYAPKGIIEKAFYHEQCHEELNFVHFSEPTKQYVSERDGSYVGRFQEQMIEVDKIASKMSGFLMPRVFKRYVENYKSVIALGFVRTIAYDTDFYVRYAVFAYIAAVLLTIILWWKNPEGMAAPLMTIVLIAIVGNVCSTSFMIECISRYMIYNFPLFYMAGFLELRELYALMKNRKG